jgi:uncharacterized membrane protein YkvA (DUF1232 family)
MAAPYRSRSQSLPAPERAPRTGAKRTVVGYILELPRFVRLLWGLITDRRVSTTDKLLLGGAIAYIVFPVDIVPDLVPFLGQVDDVYLLIVALRRLIRNAGRAVLLAHWDGDPEQLRELSLRRVLAAAAFFLPQRLQNRLRSKRQSGP